MRILSATTVGPGIITVVKHDGVAGTARPTAAGVVLWVGSVQPTNANTATDIWLDTNSIPAQIFDGTYSPTLTNVAIGTGGSVLNTASWSFAGGPNPGDFGILTISHTIILGTSGASVSGTPVMTLPPDFEMVLADASNGHRLDGIVTAVAGGVTAYGPPIRQSASTVGYQVFNAASTYLATSNISSTVPGTWAAGDSMRANFVVKAQRV